MELNPSNGRCEMNSIFALNRLFLIFAFQITDFAYARIYFPLSFR